MYIYIALTLAFLFSFSLDSRAQNVALKTNLAYDAVAAANLGLEFGLAPRWLLIKLKRLIKRFMPSLLKFTKPESTL